MRRCQVRRQPLSLRQYLRTPKGQRSPLGVATCVPRGRQRAPDPRRWLDEAQARVWAQEWRSQRRHHTLRVCKELALHMDWRARTYRAGHARLCAAARVSPDTVARVVAWLRSEGLLGLVSPGTLPEFQSFLHRDDGPQAAVYVLCTKQANHPPAPPVIPGQRDIADPSRSPEVTGPLRVREAACLRKRASLRSGSPLDRPGAGIPPPPPGRRRVDWGLPPSSTEDMRDAGAALKVACWEIRNLSLGWAVHLARPYWQAGWTLADVAHAIGYAPCGDRYRYGRPIRHPAGWLRKRLAAWDDPATGGPGLPPSQRPAAPRPPKPAPAGQSRATSMPAPAPPPRYTAAGQRAGAAPTQAYRAARAKLGAMIHVKHRGDTK